MTLILRYAVMPLDYYLVRYLENTSVDLWALQAEDEILEDQRNQARLRRGTKSRRNNDVGNAELEDLTQVEAYVQEKSEWVKEQQKVPSWVLVLRRLSFTDLWL